MGKKQAEACTPTVIMFGLCRRGMLVRGNSAVDAEFIDSGLFIGYSFYLVLRFLISFIFYLLQITLYEELANVRADHIVSIACST